MKSASFNVTTRIRANMASVKIMENDFMSIFSRVLNEYRTSIILVTVFAITTRLFNKLWVNRRFYSNDVSMKGKTVLITGGNTGIGYETAKSLFQRGARVIIACRNLEKGRQAIKRLVDETDRLDVNDIRLMECDLCSLNSIRTFAELYNNEEQRLDVLICNAGISWSKPAMTKDGFNSVIQANYLGHFLLTNLLLGKLKECRPSRIINVSSKVHQGIKTIDWSDAFKQLDCPRWFGAYPASKLFQILSAYKLKQNLYEDNIDVFALTPGWVSTSLSNPSAQAIGLIPFLCSYPLTIFLKFIFAKTPKTGASTIIYCAVEPTLEKSKHLYFQNCEPAQPSELGTDQSSSEQLWKMSIEAVQIS